MSLPRISKKARLSAAIAMALFSASVSTVYALPTDGKVQSGTAKFETSNDNTVMDITTSDRVAIDWTSFDIASGETVNFKQPGTDSIALNRIIGEDASQIYGALNANGKVFLINPNGILFGKGAQVDVGGLVASTANVSNEFMAGFGESKGNFSLSIDDANKAAIINQAFINEKLKNEGGLVVLHAANVENDGTIQTANGGTVQLAAGKTLNINYDSAKINFIVDGGLSEANVLNAGTISAQNGVIAMTARGADKVLSSVVNTENARLEAKGLTVNEKGEITLEAGTDGKAFGEGKGLVAISGTIDASGENGNDGGNITVNSDVIYVDSNAKLNASGASGGNIGMKTGNILVENNANIHAEATAGNGKNGLWKVETTNTVDSWQVSPNQLAEAKQALADAKAEVEKLFETAQEKYAEAEKAKQARDAAQAKVDELTELINEKNPTNNTNKEAYDKAKQELEDANKALTDADTKYQELKKAADAAQDDADKADRAYKNVSEAADDVAKAYEQLTKKSYELITLGINYGNFESKYNELKKIVGEELQADYLKHFYTEEGFAKHFGRVLNFIDTVLPKKWDVSLGWPSDQYEASRDAVRNFEDNKTTANKPIDDANKAKEKYDSAVKTQSDKQVDYDNAKKAFDETNNVLNGENGFNKQKEAQDALVKSNDEAQAAASKENKENLKSGMEKLVEANKAFAQTAYDKAIRHSDSNCLISSQVITNTLKNTDVTIAAHNETHTVDVGIYGDIKKDAGNATTLTLEADRNVIIRNPISSEKELNIITNAGSPIALAQGNSAGSLFGATVIYNDINTKGNLDIKGNTYVGHYIRGNAETDASLKSIDDDHTKAGTIAAKEITFGGDVVLATGDTVKVSAENDVTFGGTINSGNAYAFRRITDAEQKEIKASADSPNYWDYAREEAKKGNKNLKEAKESYLATITDALEDSAVSAVRPDSGSESYVGAKAGDWVTNEDGTETREWKWVDGPEAVETFFIQTKSADKNSVSGTAVNGYYSNFLPGEPSDTNGLQDVLATEYKNRWDDAFPTGNPNGKYYATAYIQEINVGESSLDISAKNIDLNGEIGNKRALNSIGLEGNTASIASPITTKGDMTINAALTGKNISLTSTEGSITLNNTVTAGTPKVEEAAVPQRRLMRLRSAVPTEGDIELNAAKDINSNDVTAQGKISFTAGNDVNLNGVLKSDSNEIGAVKVSAGEAFINKAGENAIQTGAGGTWQIFSDTPEKDEFNGLNSNNTAVWNATGTVDNGGKNTYSFAIQPTLTVKANDVEKTYGDVSTGKGVTVTNSIAGMKDASGADLSTAFTDTLDAAELLTGDVDVTSEGFAATATRRGGDYKGTDGKVVSENLVAWGKEYTDEKHQVKPYYEINVNGAANDTGYKVVTEKGKLTVNQADLKLHVKDITVDYGTSYGDFKSQYDVDVEGLKNSDSIDKKNFSTNAYNGSKTKNVGNYGIYYNQWPFVYNYKIDYHEGTAKINPKDVNLSIGGFEPEGSSVRILEGTPTYESQLVNGDTVETAPKVSYEVGAQSEGLNYGIDYYVDGKKISSGDTVGNYRFNYNTAAVITLDNPENYKPQTNELMTSAVALKGNADVVLSQKTAKVDGVDKVAGLMDGRLPLFKFAGSQVIPCGMFDISSTPDSVTMTASKISETDMSAAMEMPELEVNQYREYDRMLDTVDGAAAFKLTYNGASFDIYPNDNQAMALLEKGEETNNVNVGAAALSAAFGEMGLSLEEMQVICVHMDAKEILA